jgi:NTP pyrophosphatase (non-canonical NTP hydrolase)
MRLHEDRVLSGQFVWVECSDDQCLFPRHIETVDRENSVIRRIQRRIHVWAEKNFGKHPSWHPLLGMGEEMGELQHAYLKRAQGIRGTPEQHKAEIIDALGDFMVYMCEFTTDEGIDIEDTLDFVWTQVEKRDWTKNRLNGQVNQPPIPATGQKG